MKRKLKYRCGRGKCRAIYHLPKPPEAYRKEKRCDCGGKLHDYTYERKRNGRKVCHCDGWPFPHQKGSSVWCQERPTGPTEEDYLERYG